MALKSMTGFGRGEAAAGGVRAEVELSSVNRKQLDVQVCLPRGLAALESRIVQQLSRTFSRGCITVSLRLVATGGKRQVCVDDALASACIAALRRTARKLKLKDDFSARTLARLPDVLKTSGDELDSESAWPATRAALDKAQTRFAAMRMVEGGKLQKDIAKRLNSLKTRLGGIRRLAVNVPARYRDALIARLKNAGFDTAADDPQMRKELAIFADKCDISEEMTRLESHFHQASNLLASKEPVGRALDFLVQEMFREITTIGSKANDAVISQNVVMFKTELERIREQIQNVE